MEAVACDRLIEGEGTSEECWQGWLRTARIAPVSEALPRPPQGGRVVVVSPHPDDEILACGGLLAMHAGLGSEVTIVAVTDGEASHGDIEAWPREKLASARRRERGCGLARLGVSTGSVLRLGLPDGKVDRHAAALRAALHDLLRAADLVVTTWRLDGHPDHEATGQVTARACAEAGSRLLEAPVWMWHWSAPLDARVPWTRLRAVPLGADALESKRLALAEHQTQTTVRSNNAGAVLGSAILARAARGAEYFFV